MQFNRLTISILVFVLCLINANPALADRNSYECEGNFRAGFECSNAVDGDWTTFACPEAYGESASIIENHDIPNDADGAFWRFKCIRNNSQIEVKALYWDDNTSIWVEFFEVPYDLDYQTYTIPVPEEAFSSTSLKIKMFLKNAVSPQQSAEYYEGVVDWVSKPFYECDGNFRTGCECSNATDGDWTTFACPDAYGEAASIIETIEVPAGATDAFWRFRCLRNNTQIEVKASYWDYITSSWIEFFEVPFDSDYQTYTVQVPNEAFANSQLKIKMYLKNAVSPAFVRSILTFNGDCIKPLSGMGTEHNWYSGSYGTS